MSSVRLFGIHPVNAALRNPSSQIRLIRVSTQAGNPRLEGLVTAARKAGVKVQSVSRSELDRLAEGVRHQGVMAEVEPGNLLGEADLPGRLELLDDPALILVLDHIEDPHNLGACLRTAEAAGVDLVILPKDRAADLTPVARRAATGAAETLPICQVPNLARAMRAVQEAGIWITGTDSEVEQSIHDLDLGGRVAIVMGNEGEGMRRLTREHCDFLARIPMAGTTQSLNVSVATGICLFEVLRQRSG